MFNINNWKEPIIKRDLKYVILNGLLFSILGGILGGSLDFLFSYINVNISFSLIILSIFIGYRISKSYSYFHILYPVLTIPFMILGIFISYFTEITIVYGIQNFIYVITNGSIYLGFLMSPIAELKVGIELGSASNIIFGIVNILIYILAFVCSYMLAKRNRTS